MVTCVEREPAGGARLPGGVGRWVLPVVCVVLLGLPGASFAERLIGVIMSGKTPYFAEIHQAFESTLGTKGIEAQIVLQKPGADAMAWRNAARKLAAIESDVIVSYGAPATIAAMDATSSIPIVFAAVFDPQALEMEGRNATGISSGIPLKGVIQNLKAVTPFARLGVIYNEDEKDTVLQFKEMETLGAKHQYEAVPFNVKDAASTDQLKELDALFLTTSCAAMHCVQDYVGVARRARIPTATTTGGGEESGVVLTITADAHEQGTAVAELVEKVLAGEKPRDLPFERPRKVNFILNLKEARAVGLKVPFSVMTSATRVIQ